MNKNVPRTPVKKPFKPSVDRVKILKDIALLDERAKKAAKEKRIWEARYYQAESAKLKRQLSTRQA